MAKSGFTSRGESINHFNGIRIRVTGSGDLKVAVFALDDTGVTPSNTPVEILVPYAMQATTKRQPTLLANTKEQRASFEFKITEINEWFSIERIVVFKKELFTQYVGRG